MINKCEKHYEKIIMILKFVRQINVHICFLFIHFDFGLKKKDNF